MVLGAGSGSQELSLEPAVRPRQQLCQHLIPHINVISHLLATGRVDSVVGNRLLTDRLFIVILSLPVHETRAECREGQNLLLVGVKA